MVNRVKLPKSFLAVNLSETHSFHKKEEEKDASIDPIEALKEAAAIDNAQPLSENPYINELLNPPK